ncbi:DUF3883 domain-containing protein [Siccirubricoccus deserti]|uniref:DUF3883 domain-containing protein n=1 Tax=Siccirubricoccus deserti TaxID=2013562 RepID=A0A9X0QWP4_9PROT|nr:DUF3883 domain-containing protein [Siccirubricoccus deserti]MBC4014618.1 DUF3883 domain-containing protein [Siccirubricoccus deserti]
MTFKPLGPSAPRGWPVERLQDLLRRFESDPATATEWWRIASHQSAKISDRIYLFKQGDHPRGIFGIGTIIDGPKFLATDTDDERPRHRALVGFNRLVDPTKGFLLPLEAIEDVVPGQLINAMASGYSVPDQIAEELDKRLAGQQPVASGRVGEDWTPAQVEAVVSAYFAMMRLEAQGSPYTKSSFNEQVRAATGRSKGSVEFKFQNLSAVLDSMGLQWIAGYKPRGHGQVGAIKDALEGYLGSHQGFADKLEPSLPEPPPVPPSVSGVFTEPPELSIPKSPSAAPVRVQKWNRAASDARNRTLGEQGERFVVSVERRRLTAEGRSDLAARVIHTALDEGDGAGFDVASFDADGSPRLIEVKTTNGPAETPFYVTANEVRVSEDRADSYLLYRVYGFAKEPRIYCLKGSLKSGAVRLEATVYRASR